MTDLTPWNRFGSADYGPSYRVADTRPNLIDALEESWAMPQAARAADASHSSLLRVSTFSGIAIAAMCILYFAWQLLGRPGL